MKAEHVNGNGQAHLNRDHYLFTFGRRMFATFNLKVDGNIEEFQPTLTMVEPPFDKPSRYWLVKLGGHYAWVFRWPGTRMSGSELELISTDPLPDKLRTGWHIMEVLDDVTLEDLRLAGWR